MQPLTKACLQNELYVAALQSTTNLTFFRHIIEKAIPARHINRRNTEEVEASRRNGLAEAFERQRLEHEEKTQGFMEDTRASASANPSKKKRPRSSLGSNPLQGLGDASFPPTPSPIRLGFTALHEACSINDAFSVSLLIDRGALLEVVDVYGRTPLCVALEHKAVRAIGILISAGAEVGGGINLSFARLKEAEHDPFDGIDKDGRLTRKQTTEAHEAITLSPTTGTTGADFASSERIPLFYANGVRVPPIACAKSALSLSALLDCGASILPDWDQLGSSYAEYSGVGNCEDTGDNDGGSNTLTRWRSERALFCPKLVIRKDTLQHVVDAQITMLFATHRFTESNLTELIVMLAEEEGARDALGGRCAQVANASLGKCSDSGLSFGIQRLLATQRRLVEVCTLTCMSTSTDGGPSPHITCLAPLTFSGDGLTPLHIAAKLGNATVIAVLVTGFGGRGVGEEVPEGQRENARNTRPGAHTEVQVPINNRGRNHRDVAHRGGSRLGARHEVRGRQSEEETEAPYRGGGGRNAYHPQQHTRRADVLGDSREVIARLNKSVEAGATDNFREEGRATVLHYSPALFPHHRAVLEDMRTIVNMVAGLPDQTNSLQLSEDFVSSSSGVGLTPLHCAFFRWPSVSSEQRETVVRLLLQLGADVGATAEPTTSSSAGDRAGDTPIHLAASWASGTELALLLASRIDGSGSNSVGSIALHFKRRDQGGNSSCSFPRKQVRKPSALLGEDESDEPDALESRTCTVLSTRKDARRASILLSNTISTISPYNGVLLSSPEARARYVTSVLNRYNAKGLAPIHIAVREYNHEGLLLLLRAGCDTELKDESSKGMTPLLYASGKADLIAVQHLVSFGANVNATDVNGRNALHHLCMSRGGILEMERAMRLLLSTQSPNVNAQDKHGYTALQYAYVTNSRKLIEFLTAAGSTVPASPQGPRQINARESRSAVSKRGRR